MSITVDQLIEDEEKKIKSMPDKSEREEAGYRLKIEKEYFQKNGVLKAFNSIYGKC
jgi:hypothetical protein